MRFLAVSVLALALVATGLSDQGGPLRARLADAGLHVTSIFHLRPWWDTAKASPAPIDRVEFAFTGRSNKTELLPVGAA